MRKQNYKQIRKAFSTVPIREFNGNSLFGNYNVNGEFIIYSYNTPIAIIRCNKVIFFDNQYYSKTTSMHQNLIIDIFNLGTLERDCYNWEE